jgi:hypothetical protein
VTVPLQKLRALAGVSVPDLVEPVSSSMQAAIIRRAPFGESGVL